MQSVIDTAKSAATTVAQTASDAATVVVNQASALAGSATTAVGGTPATGGGHSHAEEHLHRSTLPPDSTANAVKKMDTEGLEVFEHKDVRHAVLVKINQLARDDKRHGLKELAGLELVTDAGNRGIDFYHPQRYMTVTRPFGIDYIGEIEVEDGKCIHVRCHKASATASPTFHSLDTRPGQDDGAVFKKDDALSWFDY